MKRILAVLAVGVSLQALTVAQDGPRVFSVNPLTMENLRARVQRDKFSDGAIDQLRNDAERSMKMAPVSVTEKKQTPPSGDKHDYMSLAPYWWPDPKSPNGLPYIRRDGERNPELRDFQDNRNFHEVMVVSHTLALGYYIFGDERYAAKATELLRTWFIDAKTRMNPNFQYAQAVRGHSDGRGTGLIESREVAKLVDVVGLLADSKAWTSDDQKAMEKWCSDFLGWMRTSKNGKAEAAAKNNHGSFYDVQVTALALFARDSKFAEEVARSACRKRIGVQIEKDGRQPLELERTKSMSYSAFNLEALMELAVLGESAGVDLWSCRAKEGGIRAALDFLAPSASGARPWEYQQIEPVDKHELARLFAIASVKYQDPKYFNIAKQVDTHVETDMDFELARSHRE